MIYRFQTILILFIIALLLNPIVAENKSNELPRENSPTSRVLIGDGARVIVDTESSAKIWYDDVLLSKGGIFQESLSANDETKLSDKSEASLSQETVGIPTELEISKAYPNPFNPTVSISYGLPIKSDVRILIHDLSGRKITEYNQYSKTSGWHEFIWDATDGDGNGIGSGVYLLTIQASDMVKKQKLTFIK